MLHPGTNLAGWSQQVLVPGVSVLRVGGDEMENAFPWFLGEDLQVSVTRTGTPAGVSDTHRNSSPDCSVPLPSLPVFHASFLSPFLPLDNGQ